MHISYIFLEAVAVLLMIVLFISVSSTSKYIKTEISCLRTDIATIDHSVSHLIKIKSILHPHCDYDGAKAAAHRAVVAAEELSKLTCSARAD
jgi:hypothetical protein